MSSKAQIIRKLQAYKQSPDLIKEVSNTELADLVLVVMGAVQAIDEAIKEGRLDGFTPQPDKDYLSKESAIRMLKTEINKMLDQADRVLSTTSTELEKRVQQALQNIRDGKNGIVTEAEIARAAKIASSLIELPNFDALVINSLTQNANATRDGLESIVNEDDKLRIEAIGYLRKELDELESKIGQKVNPGGGLSEKRVRQLITELASSGGFTELTATGDANGVNTVFTFTQVPSYIVADGVWYKPTAKNGTVFWTNVSTSVTMVNPPAYDIFGVA